MPITHAVQNGMMVVVYDGNRIKGSIQGKLHGFTGSTVSIKSGGMIVVYSEDMRIISSVQG